MRVSEGTDYDKIRKYDKTNDKKTVEGAGSHTDLSDDLDKVLGVLGTQTLHLASAGLQGRGVSHDQHRISCQTEAWLHKALSGPF